MNPRARLPGLLLAAAAWPVLACPLAAPTLDTGRVQAAWQVTGGAPMAVGQLFAIDVQLCPASAVLARVDATMPAHRHGMNYRPSVQALGPGRWRVNGMLFHMPGRWQLQLDVQSDAASERLLDAIELQ